MNAVSNDAEHTNHTGRQPRYNSTSVVPRWVVSGPHGPEMRLPLYPQKRTFSGTMAMSVKYQSRKWAHLLDHLVGAGEKRWRNFYAELFRRLEIYHQFELGGLHNRKFGRLFALKDASHIEACLSPCVR
jgi:hypothetical protein